MSDRSPERPASGSERILLVEDERAIRRLATTILEREGYTVLAASDADRAWGAAGDLAEAPRLVISDLVLPDRNGLELVGRLRERWPDLPALLVSGHPERAEALPDGVSFLAKPFGPAELVDAVRRKLGSGPGAV